MSATDRAHAGVRPDFSQERRLQAAGVWPVAGVDEAGRGCLAGPVVAAAVILDPVALPGWLAASIDDSKRLLPARRQEIAAALADLAAAGHAGIAIAEAGLGEIAALNILGATLLAMTRAVAALIPAPAHVLVDGNRLPALAMPATALVGGDRLSLAVAAASILAKVHRDQLMDALDQHHPGYGFARHKGYGTAAHRAALRRLGPSPAHRLGFRGVGDAVPAEAPSQMGHR